MIFDTQNLFQEADAHTRTCYGNGQDHCYMPGNLRLDRGAVFCRMVAEAVTYEAAFLVHPSHNRRILVLL